MIDIRTMYRDQLTRKRNKENPKVVKMDKDQAGFGPINKLLLDEEVTQVMVNGPDQVYCERKGKLVLTPFCFHDNKHIINVIENVIAKLGKRINESVPIINTMLPDGSHIHAMIPPLAKSGPTMMIKKCRKGVFQIEDLINAGTLTEEIAIFLNACVKARINMFVSGGAGSGKATILDILSRFIPEDRQDRAIIGEVNNVEALNLLHSALSSDKNGLLVTVNSKSPRDMMALLETMLFVAGGGFPERSIREQLSGVINLIISQSRLEDGSRRIVSITEVQGMIGDTIVLQDIFTFKQEGLNSEGGIMGRLVPTGVRPKLYDRFEASGIPIPESMFIKNNQ
jgi:pilus assembly protein CpaF